jgi:hypothetical protein
MDIGVLDFFNKKLILDYYLCLMSGPVLLFQIFITVFSTPYLFLDTAATSTRKFT